MVKASDGSAADVERVNQQLEDRHYEFRSNCNEGEGDASACHSWGEWLAVVDKNYTDAAKMYELNCSKNGFPASCFNLGRLKLSGKGTAQNDVEAFKLFATYEKVTANLLAEKSCAKSHAAGCHHVGFMRTQGVGCEKDFVKGLAAFKKACERDDANSCNRVASMYLSPGVDSPIQRNVQQAKSYLEKACDANFAPACHNLAVMYKKGDNGIPKDEAKYEEYCAKTKKLVEQAGGMSSIKSTVYETQVKTSNQRLRDHIDTRMHHGYFLMLESSQIITSPFEHIEVIRDTEYLQDPFIIADFRISCAGHAWLATNARDFPHHYVTTTSRLGGMAALAASSLNGVKIYNLSSGKTLPQWLAEKSGSRKALAKDEDYRRRVELLQDFHFPASCQRVRMSSDGHFVVATGVYPPLVKVFDVRDLSLKFERGLDAEVVQFEVLSSDFGKLAFLQADRSVTFHAPYGAHYSLRIPKFGRDMTYHRENCELYVAASGSEVYRINLDQGRFVSPLELQSQSSAANVVQLNPIHQLLGVGCEDGVVEMFDSRSQQRVGSLDVAAQCARSKADKQVEITALRFDDDGLTFGVGTSEGQCLLYDLRSTRPLLEKSHQYGLPIVNLQFHDYARKVISSDAKVIKIWDRQDGAVFTNVETPAAVKDVCIVEGAQGKSGVLLVAGEQERVMSYYIPELGIAPKWCSFLDSLTEELEEEAQATVYDDYRFVTRAEIASLGLDHLVGTPLLKAYMHGFFMDARLHKKVKAVTEPFAYDEWRKKKLVEKVEAKHSNRITIQRRLPTINRATAERILQNEGKRNKKNNTKAINVEDVDADKALSNPLGDERFSRMFTSTDYEVDEESETYRMLHPNAASSKQQQRKQQEDMDSDAVTDDDEGEDDDVGGRFARVDEDDDVEVEGRPSDESSDEEDQDDSYKRTHQVGAPKGRRKGAPKFYEIAEGEKMGDLMTFGSSRDRAAQREKKQLAKVPLAERLRMQRVTEKERSAFKKETAGGGYMREMSFVPQADLRKQQRARERKGGDIVDDGDSAFSNGKRRKKRGVGDLKLSNPAGRRKR